MKVVLELEPDEQDNLVAVCEVFDDLAEDREDPVVKSLLDTARKVRDQLAPEVAP